MKTECVHKWTLRNKILAFLMQEVYTVLVGLCAKLEMWANAQRDGRPAEYSWRPLFNAAKFG